MATAARNYSEDIKLSETQSVTQPLVNPDLYRMATTQQPRRQYHFDPASQGVISGLRTTHMSHDVLNSVVTSASHAVSSATEAGRTTAQGGLNYDQFLQGIMLPDEHMLLSGQYLYYTQVDFTYVQMQYGNPPPKPRMTQGRVFITNRRMLFLSAEEYQGLTFQDNGTRGQDSKPQSYHMRSTASDVLHYQSLPLQSLKSLEFHSSMGTSSDTDIRGYPPSFCFRACGWMQSQCCCNSCESAECLKSWLHDQPVTSTVNFRQLTFGTLLPPWDNRGMVTIHLHQAFSLSVVRDFIAEIQRHAPGLQCQGDKTGSS